MHKRTALVFARGILIETREEHVSAHSHAIGTDFSIVFDCKSSRGEGIEFL